MLETTRTDEQYQALVQDAISAELARARAGETAVVSAKAAARFLGLHVETLGEWRRAEPPKGPPFMKGADGVGRANEGVSYLYQDLIDWIGARTGKSFKERKLLDQLEQLRQRERELELELQIQARRDEVAKLAKKLGRKLSFASLADCALPQDWTTDGECITGHVLTVDDATLAAALSADQIITASLEEALALPWADDNTREPFDKAFDAVVETVRERIKNGQDTGGVIQIRRRRAALGDKTTPLDKPGGRKGGL